MNEKLQLWFELSELQHRYVNTIDSDQLEAWPDFFTEDGTLQDHLEGEC